MVTDRETNFVCVSDLLAGRFPSIYEGLERILGEHGIGFGVVRGTKDIWIRDYAPIQVDRDGSFVLFRYFSDYLRQWDHDLITDARKIISGFPGVRSCEFSDIVLDGGNVVRHHHKAIVTDKIYKENPGIGRAELRERLRMTCSPWTGPSGMRVILALEGRRTFDEAYPPLARADHPQAP